MYMLEENLIQGQKTIDYTIKLSELLIDLYKIDNVIIVWRESPNYINDIKSIFKCNNLFISDYITQFKESNPTIGEIIGSFYGKLSTEYREESNILYYNKINSLFQSIIFFIMKDSRKIAATEEILKTINKNANPHHSMLKQMLVDTINNAYNYQGVLEEALGLSSNTSKCKIVDLEYLASSFLFPCIKNMIDNEYLSYDSVSIEPWINRLHENAWFYHDVGLGGTITHITKEYLGTVTSNNKIKIAKCDFNAELHHRIMRLGHVLLKELSKNYTELVLKTTNLSIKDLNIKDNGTELLFNLIRPLNGVFSLRNQSLLYAYSFFLLRFITNLRETQKEVIYFIPKFVIEIPILCFSILMAINSPYLLNNNNTFLKDIHIKCPELVNGNYLVLLLSFYNDILSDNNINNPEIIEYILKSINVFVKFPLTCEAYIQNKGLLSSFLSCHVKHLSNENLSGLVFQNIFELIKPACFRSKIKEESKDLVKSSLKACFQSNNDFYYQFLDAYSNLLNKDITNYSNNLEELLKQFNKISNFSTQENQIRTYWKTWDISFKHFNEALELYELVIYSSPDLFDTNSLSYSRFLFFLTTLATRILCDPYAKLASDFTKKFGSDQLGRFFLSLLGIFKAVKQGMDNIEKIKVENFITSVAKNEINFSIMIASMKKGLEETSKIEEYSEYYNVYVDVLSILKESTDKHILKNTDTVIDDEKLCHICYTNEKNTIMLPCEHSKY
jgi:hypothetical protein